VPVAVEETLRLRPPVQILFRRPIENVVLAGVPVPAGSTVAVGYGSANHDEAVFADPETSNLDRDETTRRHLGFGWGIHHCVGAPLARLEVTCVLDAVLDRIPSMELAADFGYEPEPSRELEYGQVVLAMMQGPLRLDVTFDPS
jgi:cytochrome P450